MRFAITALPPILALLAAAPVAAAEPDRVLTAPGWAFRYAPAVWREDAGGGLVCHAAGCEGSRFRFVATVAACDADALTQRLPEGSAFADAEVTRTSIAGAAAVLVERRNRCRNLASSPFVVCLPGSSGAAVFEARPGGDGACRTVPALRAAVSKLLETAAPAPARP